MAFRWRRQPAPSRSAASLHLRTPSTTAVSETPGTRGALAPQRSPPKITVYGCDCDHVADQPVYETGAHSDQGGATKKPQIIARAPREEPESHEADHGDANDGLRRGIHTGQVICRACRNGEHDQCVGRLRGERGRATADNRETARGGGERGRATAEYRETARDAGESETARATAENRETARDGDESRDAGRAADERRERRSAAEGVGGQTQAMDEEQAPTSNWCDCQHRVIATAEPGTGRRSGD